ncbi:hypothetical protein [Amycolatopsis sp. CFH S0078]|uniref:hypothetical protein n=1 Tax=Amycolatopsis sp. CFH S0078 TaxID=1644108 RepID=UPI00106E6C30|nr:hypothetical protein [Amycolatopsis sp. CFH S0078]
MNLCELINMIKERDGLTWRQLTNRATEKGAPTPTGLFYLGDPNRPMVDFPRTKTIYGIAAALDVEPEIVAAAALESLGLQPSNVVEVTAKRVEVVTSGESDTPQTRKDDRWIKIIPNDDVSDDALRACCDSADLRVTVPTGEARTAR